MSSAKKKEEKVTKKSTRQSMREEKQNRLIIIGFIITAILIVGMVAYALLYDTVIKNYIPVAKVGNVNIDNTYFEQRVRLERNSHIQQFTMIYEQYQMFASIEGYEDYLDYYLSQMQQIQATLDNSEAFGKIIIEAVVDDQVIASKAAEFGIEVTDEEIDALMMVLFNYYPDGTPTPEPTTTPYTTPTISAEQEALLGYTPTLEVANEEIGYEDVEEVEELIEEFATAEETEVEDPVSDEETEADVDNEESTELNATATVVPTATAYTKELYQQELTNYISDLEEIGVEEKYLRKYIYHYLLNQKVLEKIYEDVPVEQEQVWARHILVETEEEAQEVLSRLDDGEDWNVIAAEVSLDTSNSSNGGDLGWFNMGYMVEPFEEAAYALAVGQISDPVETDFGWHIIQAIGHENRPLSASDYQYAQQIAYEKWFEAAKEEMEIEINNVWKDLAPDEPSLTDLIAAN